MADAVQVFDDRYPGVFCNALNQSLAATGDDYIDGLWHADHGADCRPVGGGNHLHRIARQAGLFQAALDAGGDCLV